MPPPLRGRLASLLDDQHVVQLYKDDRFLVETIALWSIACLDEGGSAVLLGTSAHNASVAARIAAAGHDAAALQAADRLVLVDAEAFLPRFYRGGSLDSTAFHDLVRALLGKARDAARGREVRAWGELVDLLRRRGDPTAAQALEVLWSRLLVEDDARLLCTYHVADLDLLRRQGLLPEFAFAHERLLLDQDEDRFESAVRQALAEAVGGPEAAALAARLVPRGPGASVLPRGDALLLGLQQARPDVADQVLQRAGAFYAQGSVPPV